MVGNLLRVLPKEKFTTNADRVVWRGNGRDSYSVRKAYFFLQPCSDLQCPSKGVRVPSSLQSQPFLLGKQPKRRF